MKTSVVFTVLATCAAMATASFQPPEKDTTTTLTSTITLTYTLTECESDVPDCPINKPPPTPTPEAAYVPEPGKETDTEAEPAYPTSSAEYAAPLDTSSYEVPDYTSKPPTIAASTSVVDAGSSSTPPVTVPISGASGLFLSNSLALGAVAVGVALLA